MDIVVSMLDVSAPPSELGVETVNGLASVVRLPRRFTWIESG